MFGSRRRPGRLVALAGLLAAHAWAAGQDRIIVISEAGDATAIAKVEGLGRYLEGHGFPTERVRIERREVDPEPEIQRRALGALLRGAPYRVVIATNMASAAIVRQVDPRTPVVFDGATDPIVLCLAQSLTHPGFNATGQTSYVPIAAKLIEALRDAFPTVRRVIVLVDGTKEDDENDERTGCDQATAPLAGPARRPAGQPCRPGAVARPEEAYIDELRPMLVYARRENVQLLFHRLCAAANFGALSRYAAVDGSTGVLVPFEFLFYQEGDEVVRTLNRLRLPAIYARKSFTERGGLMSLSPIVPDQERLFELVLQVLRGADPGALPVQVVRGFEFWINVRTARQTELAPSLRALTRAERLLD